MDIEDASSSNFSVVSDGDEAGDKSKTNYQFSRGWRFKDLILQAPDWQTVLSQIKIRLYWNDNIGSGPIKAIGEYHSDSPIQRDKNWHEIEAKDVPIYFTILDEHGGDIIKIYKMGFDRRCGHEYHLIEVDIPNGSSRMNAARSAKMDGSHRLRVTNCR